MDYTQTTWVDDDGTDSVGTVITAARMNNIEAGVLDAAQNAHARGTYSARPAAATANKNWFYYATDVNVLYRSTGSTWERVAADALLGELVDYTGVLTPTGCLAADGSAISRTTYADLFAATTLRITGNTTSGQSKISNVVSSSNLAAGMYVSGTGIPVGTTVLSVTASGGFFDVNLSAATTATNSGVTFTFNYWGLGDGSTTFNLPDPRGRATIGGGSGSGLTPRTAGQSSGAESVTLDTTMIPSHAHPGSSATSSFSGTGTSGGPQTMNSNLGSAAGFNPGWYNGSLANSFTPAGAANTHTHTTTISGTPSVTVTIQPQGGGLGHDNMQPWLAIGKYVKVY